MLLNLHPSFTRSAGRSRASKPSSSLGGCYDRAFVELLPLEGGPCTGASAVQGLEPRDLFAAVANP